MTKRKAIVKFCIIGAILLVGLVSVFAKFHVPFTNQEYQGLWGAIESKMGIDLRGGVLAVFDCEGQDNKDISMTEVKATENRLLNSLNAAGLTEATVQIQGNDGNYKIRVEVPGLDNTDEIFEAVGTPAVLFFTLDKIPDEDLGKPTQVANTKKWVEAKDISKVTVYQNPQTYEYGVLLTFTNPGGKKFRDMISETWGNGSKMTYIYRAGTGGATELVSQVTVSDDKAGSNNTTVITLGKEGATRKDADKFKLEIESGLYSVLLNISEQSIIPQTLGEGALMWSLIALAVGILFIIVFMYWRYRDLGLLSNLTLATFIILFAFSLAIVDAVQLTLPGIAGIVLSIAMSVDANVIIFERIRDEYRNGKRLSVAVQNGFSKSFWTIFDANITTIIGAAVLYFLGTGPIRGFAIVLMLGVVISMFCSLFITKSFAKLYLYINPNKAKRLSLENTNPYITEDIKSASTPKVIKPVGKRALNMGGAK